MMEPFALPNINNLTQRSGTALHTGKTPDGSVFLMFLAMHQLAAEQASIPSETFPPDSNGDVLKALGNGRKIDLTKVTIATVEKGAELAYNKKTPHLILNGRIQHPASQDAGHKTQDSGQQGENPDLGSSVLSLESLNIQHQASSIKHQILRHSHHVAQPSIVHIASQPETIERILHISPPDQPFLRIKPAADRRLPITDHRSRITDHGLRITGHGSPVTDHQSRITNYGSRTHDAAYTNARETLPGSSVLRPAAIPDDINITGSPHTIILAKASAEEQTPYASPKSDTFDLWAREAGNIEGKKLGDGIIFAKYRSGYTEANPEVSVQVKHTTHEAYRPLETEHAPQVDASQVKPSAQIQRLIYVSNGSGSQEHQRISEIGERPVIDNATYSRSGSLADEVIETPIPEDNPGSSELQQSIKPGSQIALTVDRSQITRPISGVKGSPESSLQDSGLRFAAISSSASQVAPVAEKVQESQPQKIIAQTPREHVPIEDGVQEIQPELVADEQVDRIHQPLWREIIAQNVQGHGKHPQVNDQVRIGARHEAAPLGAFEAASVVEKVQESQPQKIIPQTLRGYVRTADNIQKIQPELVAEEEVNRIHQPPRQEIITQNVQAHGDHPQVNDQVRTGTRHEAATLDAFQAASVVGKLQESQPQKTIPRTPLEYVRTEGNIQKIQPELVAEEKVDSIHQPLQREIITRNVQGYSKHPQVNDEVRIGTRHEVAPSDAFEVASVAEKVQESQLQETITQTLRGYVRTEDNIQKIRPELVAEEKIDKIHHPPRQEIIAQDMQQYGKHLEPNDEAKIEARYEAAPVVELVQESQPQKTMPQTPREYVWIEGNTQEIQPEPVAEYNVDRIHQPLRQEVGPQGVQEYGKHLELNDEAEIKTRYEAAPSNAFEEAPVAEKVQMSQPHEIVLQPVQQSVRAKDDVQEFQPELSRSKETGRIHQSTHQAVSSQDLQEYGKHFELRTESQPYGKEIQAASSMPELPDKIPFYVSKMVAGERSEAIWIQLEPEHLGKVKLRVLLRDNRISVNLSVNRPETKEIIEAQVPDIRRSLAQHEIKLAEFRVSLENGFSNFNPRYSNLLQDNADTDSRPAYEQGDWNRSKGEHNTRQRYYTSDSLVDLLA